MRRSFRAVFCTAVLALTSSAMFAQWPPYPAARIPKNAEGKPDLTAPPPRTADGKPDLSGIWQNARGAAANLLAQSGNAPTQAAANASMSLFRDVGTGVQGGLPIQPWAAELVKKRRADNSKDNPDAHCLPMGFMQFHNHPQPRKIVQTPDLVVIMYEANFGLRQIFTNGRS